MALIMSLVDKMFVVGYCFLASFLDENNVGFIKQNEDHSHKLIKLDIVVTFFQTHQEVQEIYVILMINMEFVFFTTTIWKIQ